MADITVVTPFRLPDDPVARAELVARFWRDVAMPQAGAEVAHWLWTGGRLYQFSRGYQRWAARPARAAWTICTGEVLGDDVTHCVPRCGVRDCVRLDHLRVYQRHQLATDARALSRQGLKVNTIARRLGVSWNCVRAALREAA